MGWGVGGVGQEVVVMVMHWMMHMRHWPVSLVEAIAADRRLSWAQVAAARYWIRLLDS